MRNLLRNIFLSIIGQFTSPSESFHIVNGHFISEENGNVPVFENLLKQLSNTIKLVDFDFIVSQIIENIPSENATLAFSFDDGYEDCYTEVAPTLSKYNINAAFFICPGFINLNGGNFLDYVLSHKLFNKRPMNWEMISELIRNGFIIGSHTYDHVNLNTCSEKELLHQIVDSKKAIEDKTGRCCDYFAWPYGKYDDISQRALELAIENYKYIFSATDYKYYTSSNGSVINRRHFEGDWSVSHLNYFLSFDKKYK